MLVGSDWAWAPELGWGIEGVAVSSALSDLVWWGAVGTGVLLLLVLRDPAAEGRGVVEGSTSIMLAKRRSAWWKASCRCAMWRDLKVLKSSWRTYVMSWKHGWPMRLSEFLPCIRSSTKPTAEIKVTA